MEETACEQRYAYNRAQAEQHRERLEGEALVVRREEAGEVDGGRQVDHRLAAQQARRQPHHVARQRAVRVRVPHVDDADELREEDDVDEVRAQVPQAVDGRYGDAHHRGERAHAQDGGTHRPDDLAVRRLQRSGRGINTQHNTHHSQLTSIPSSTGFIHQLTINLQSTFCTKVKN